MENIRDDKFSQNQEMDSNKGTPRLSPFGYLFRFIASWFGFTGLYSMFAVCPFCGQQCCPVGIASAGTVGAFFALCFQDWKRLFVYIKRKRIVKNHKKA
jgi:hypothetical protein